MRKLALACSVVLAVAAAVASGAFARQTAPIHGKVVGHFASASSCFGCGDMVKYVRVDRVWCAWQGDNVVIHVRFRNTSIEHIKITWHPSYVVRGGGSHGDGFSSLQETELNAHAVRGAFITQQPKGVPSGSALATCKPSFSLVGSS
jgi:hypothetical protein